MPTVDAHIQLFLASGGKEREEVEVLLYAIICVALHSLSETRCLELFSKARDKLLSHYSAATREGLVRIRFLGTSSLTVLRAFCIYLIYLRMIHDGRTFWVLTGTALRIASSMQYDIDGTFQNLSPFQTELQRRLWFFLAMTDSKAAEFTRYLHKFGSFDAAPQSTRRPTCINDVDLTPDMSEMPTDSKKITDLSFVALRTDVGRSLQASPGVALPEDSREDGMRKSDWNLDELGEYLRETYTKQCTPTIPMHLFLAILSTHAPDVLRFMVHHPKRWPESVHQAKHDMVYKCCITILNGFISSNSNSMLQGF